MTSMLRWDPLAEFERELASFWPIGRPDSNRWSPHMQASRTEDGMLLRLDLPGVHPDDVKLNVVDNVLAITGERREDGHVVGKFERRMMLPEGIDAGGIRASFDLGVLRVYVPNPARPEPVSISIEVGSGGESHPQVEAGSESAETTS